MQQQLLGSVMLCYLIKLAADNGGQFLFRLPWWALIAGSEPWECLLSEVTSTVGPSLVACSWKKRLCRFFLARRFYIQQKFHLGDFYIFIFQELMRAHSPLFSFRLPIWCIAGEQVACTIVLLALISVCRKS